MRRYDGTIIDATPWGRGTERAAAGAGGGVAAAAARVAAVIPDVLHLEPETFSPRIYKPFGLNPLNPKPITLDHEPKTLNPES
jgi:hypothetical protein